MHLKDGSRVKGTVVKQDRKLLTIESSVGKLEIPLANIERVEYGKDAGKAPAAPAAPAPTAPPPPVAAPTPECKMGSDGNNVCGYHCQMGSDGKVACADTPDGKCSMSSNGRITCTKLARVAPPAVDRKPMERKMNSNGTWTEGYNCKFGSNGQWYCASTPDGDCRLNSNGTFSCP